MFFCEGPQLPKKIRALASYRELTFAANGNVIAVFKRAHQVFPHFNYCLSTNEIFFIYFRFAAC